MAGKARHYQIGAAALTLESDDGPALEDYERLYAAFRVDAAPAGALHFEIRRRRCLPWSQPAYVVVAGAQEYVAGPDRGSVLPELEAAVNHQVVVQRQEFLQFHSGVMALRGQAVMFTAESGTGKTTLAAALLMRGWQYLSDELALVDPSTLLVHPFPKALCIKPAGRALIESLGLRVPEAYRRRSRYPLAYVSAVAARSDCLGGPCPVSHMLFLSGDRYKGLRVRRMSPAEAALSIYRAALNTQGLGRQGFHAAVALAQGASCYELNLGTVQESCRCLESLVTSGSRHERRSGQVA